MIPHLLSEALPYILGAIVIWVFVGWPIKLVVVDRARLRQRLRKLLGTAYAQEKAYVRSKIGLAVNDEARVFAVARRRLDVLCKAEDILDVTLGPSPSPQFGGQTFKLDTRTETLPNVRIDTFSASQKLGEITARLKAMQMAATAEAAKSSSPVVEIQRTAYLGWQRH